MVQYPEHPYFLLTLLTASGSIWDDKDGWSVHREEDKAKNEADKQMTKISISIMWSKVPTILC